MRLIQEVLIEQLEIFGKAVKGIKTEVLEDLNTPVTSLSRSNTETPFTKAESINGVSYDTQYTRAEFIQDLLRVEQLISNAQILLEKHRTGKFK